MGSKVRTSLPDGSSSARAIAGSPTWSASVSGRLRRAGSATDAAIGCHITSGVVAHEALDVVERSGYRAERFVWIHADLASDRSVHQALARRGAWVEFDTIGLLEGERDPSHLDMIQHMLDVGLGHRLLLSMDSNWICLGAARLPGRLPQGIHVPGGVLPVEASQSRRRRGHDRQADAGESVSRISAIQIARLPARERAVERRSADTGGRSSARRRLSRSAVDRSGSPFVN